MQLESYDNPYEAINSVQNFLDNNIKFDGDYVLEAGCGSLSRIKIPGGVKLVGIDVSQKQLDRNPLLSERICGDLQSYPLELQKFRLCVCWDVIEHIAQPELALKNLCNSIKAGGYIILALPNVRSLKGIVTKISPHWFHVWYYKKILGIKDAGENDTAPFPTHLAENISAPSIMHFLKSSSFDVQCVIYRDAMVHRLKTSHYFLWLIYFSISFLLNIFTLGFCGGKNNSDFIVIAKKVVAAQA